MIDIYDNLYKDFEAVMQIPIVATMLDVICDSTGMGFAAVARVTEDRWLACSVRDTIDFGLKPGEELSIETTICNEIRDNVKAVVIDHVDVDKKYLNHHTPKIYGFQSYISFPIILKNGDFFGTLCAIDPKPAQLDNPKVIGMFSMFAELLSFHLQSFDMMERNHFALLESNRQLAYTQDENQQYRQISNHNIREPLRKLSVYSDILARDTETQDAKKVQKIALKINSLAQEVSKMIQDLNEFSELDQNGVLFEMVDLNKTMFNVCSQISQKLKEKNVVISNDLLPSIFAIPLQMVQLFFHLINNAISFSSSDTPSVIKIYWKNLPQQTEYRLPGGDKIDYCEICIDDSSMVNSAYTMENAFDIFVHSNDNQKSERYDAGLAYCRKIVHNHGGVLTARSMPDQGVCFCIVMPIKRNQLI